MIRSGVCSFCGCDYWNPCPEGCGWANREQTICTACADIAKAFRLYVMGWAIQEGRRVGLVMSRGKWRIAAGVRMKAGELRAKRRQLEGREALRLKTLPRPFFRGWVWADPDDERGWEDIAKHARRVLLPENSPKLRDQNPYAGGIRAEAWLAGRAAFEEAHRDDSGGPSEATRGARGRTPAGAGRASSAARGPGAPAQRADRVSGRTSADRRVPRGVSPERPERRRAARR